MTPSSRNFAARKSTQNDPMNRLNHRISLKGKKTSAKPNLKRVGPARLHLPNTDGKATHNHPVLASRAAYAQNHVKYNPTKDMRT